MARISLIGGGWFADDFAEHEELALKFGTTKNPTHRNSPSTGISII